MLSTWKRGTRRAKSRERPGEIDSLATPAQTCGALAASVIAVDEVHTAPRPCRICFNLQQFNLSNVFAGQKVGIKQVIDEIWLVSFMNYDLCYLDYETCRFQQIDNPFAATVLPRSPL